MSIRVVEVPDRYAYLMNRIAAEVLAAKLADAIVVRVYSGVLPPESELLLGLKLDHEGFVDELDLMLYSIRLRLTAPA